MRLAIINDYQNLAAECATWYSLALGVTVEIFNDRLTDGTLAAERLLPYDIIVAAREETRFDAQLITERISHPQTLSGEPEELKPNCSDTASTRPSQRLYSVTGAFFMSLTLRFGEVT